MSAILEHALAYATELGWKLFPIEPSTKCPYPGTRGFLAASSDPDQIRAWFAAEPEMWIGLALRPSGLIAIDVDVADSKPGIAQLAQLERTYGPLPRTVHARSARGGEHLIMRNPDLTAGGWTDIAARGGACRANPVMPDGRRLHAVDVKNCGYVVVFPSGRYEWLTFDPSALADVPERWIAAIRKPTEELQAIDGDGIEAWTESLAPAMTDDDHRRLQAKLAAIGKRGDGERVVFQGVLAIFHHWGLSLDEGRPILNAWNAGCGQPLSSSELQRQLGRIAASGRAEGVRGNQRGYGLKLGLGKIAASPARGATAAIIELPPPILPAADDDEIGSWPAVEQTPTPAPAVAVVTPEASAPPTDEQAPPAFSIADLIAQVAAQAPTAEAQPAQLATRLGVMVAEVATSPRPPVKRYASGLPELDTLLGGGISTRQLAVIQAPPGDGKSALVVSIATYVQRTVPVLYASTELETSEIEARIAAPIIGCPWRDIVDGRVPRERIVRAVEGLRIRIVGSEALPMGDAAINALAAEVAAMTAEHGEAPVLALDYLQDLARGADERGVRGKIGELAMRLRAMSQELDCAVLAVSSVSRTYYGVDKATTLRKADDPTVYLAAAKESGDVDYAAAVVIFLDVMQREEGADHRVARIAVAKSRHGQTGFVGARFAGATGRWSAGADIAVAKTVARAESKRREQDTADDAAVLAEVQARATAGEYLSRRMLRTMIPGVSEPRAGAALDRLTRPSGALELCENHPVTRTPMGRNGMYVVPRRDHHAVKPAPHPATHAICAAVQR